MTSDALDTDIHPITVISMPNANGTIKATSCLIDQCCTGSGMIASKLVKILGLQVIQTSLRLFNTANGVLTTNSQIIETQVKLPLLSKQCKFKITLQSAPQQMTMNHEVILGLKTMKQIDWDTSVHDSSISWSRELMTLMVSCTFCTKDRLQKMVDSLNVTHADPVLHDSPAQ
jgi:hypothetical protein